MKKLLLGTSALIGATAIVASASAAPELTISGTLDFRLIGGDAPAHNVPFRTIADAAADDAERTDAQNRAISIEGRNDANADNGVGTNNSGYNFSRATHSASEIRFLARGESDGGVTYGADIQYRYQQPGTDESYIFVAGDFGRVHLGDDDGVADGTPYWGSVAAGSAMIDGWDTSIGRHGFGTGDATKVSYFSNDLGGLSFGVSLGNTGEEDAAVFDTVYELRVSYGADFGGGSFDVGLGYKGGSAPSTTVVADQTEDLAEYILGASVTFGDFSIAGAFTDAGDSGELKTNTRAEARSAAGVSVAYNLGGGMAISLGFADAETKAQGAGAADTDTTTQNSITALDFGFPIMDGMVGYAGIAKTETEIGRGPNNSTDATTYLVGTTVSF